MSSSSELLLIDIRSELRQMKTSAMGSETKLKFLDKGEKVSFFIYLHIETRERKRQRARLIYRDMSIAGAAYWGGFAYSDLGP